MATRRATPGSSAPTPVERLAADYLASCDSRGLSRASIEQYRFSLSEVFLPWCREEGISELAELTQAALDRFTAHLLEKGGRRGQLARTTSYTYIRHVRQLLKWARAETAFADAQPRLPRVPRQPVDVLSRDEIERLEDAAQTERDKLIVRVLADTGIRAGELCSLRIPDIRREERRVLLRIHGTGSNERVVPLRFEIGQRLDRLNRHRPRGYAGEVFVSLRRGPTGDYEPLTTSGVGQLLRAIAHRANIKKRVHPNLLRHSFATEALRRGMNPVQLAQVLGYSGLRMIEATYAQLSARDPYDAVMRIFAAES